MPCVTLQLVSWTTQARRQFGRAQRVPAGNPSVLVCQWQLSGVRGTLASLMFMFHLSTTFQDHEDALQLFVVENGNLAACCRRTCELFRLRMTTALQLCCRPLSADNQRPCPLAHITPNNILKGGAPASQRTSQPRQDGISSYCACQPQARGSVPAQGCASGAG